MIQQSHRTIHSLYQAAKLTHIIHITAEQFYSRDLKDLQLYEFDNLVFFRACSQLWELDEETGRFRSVHPIKAKANVVTYSIGATL